MMNEDQSRDNFEKTLIKWSVSDKGAAVVFQ